MIHEQPLSLAGRIVVITGGAGLLGRHHAEAVAEAGGVPVVIDLHLDAAEALAADIASRHGVAAAGYAVDITIEEAVRANAEVVAERFGHIDGLVNNAANNPKVESRGDRDFSRLEHFPLSVWDADLAVGLTGAFLCAKYYGAVITRQGGNIVNISSDLGLIAPDQRLYWKPGLPDHMQPVKPVTYSVVKSGLIGLTRYLATYWAKQGVRCNALCPGGVENGQDLTFLEAVASRIPMGRLARPDEYRASLIFLLSDASSYMTGAILSIDGGRTTW